MAVYDPTRYVRPKPMNHCLTISLGIFISAILLSACSTRDYRTADRSSAGIAKTPQEEPAALVQLYAARTINWRGTFAVHSWFATKEKDADHYKVYHVIGWRLRRNLSPVVIEADIPDRKWFDAVPDLLLEIKGPRAEKIIPKIEKYAASYPYPNSYRAWPGPNSNTFVSYILRNVPEIGMELPPHAIGKDWLSEGYLFGLTEAGTGVQFSLLGALGFVVGLNEGFELNVLGLNFGIDFLRPALKLPLIGRVGFRDKPWSFADE